MRTSSSRARLSAGQVQLARHPGLSKSLLVTQEASPLAMAKERIGERMASRAFEMRNAAEHAEAQLFGVNKLQREDSISTSIVKVADMESAARHYYDLTCLFSLSGIIFAMLELEFLHWNYNEANTWTMAFKSMVTGLTMLSLLVLTKYHYLKFEILKARRLIPPDESFVYSNVSCKVGSAGREGGGVGWGRGSHFRDLAYVQRNSQSSSGCSRWSFLASISLPFWTFKLLFLLTSTTETGPTS